MLVALFAFIIIDVVVEKRFFKHLFLLSIYRRRMKNSSRFNVAREHKFSCVVVIRLQNWIPLSRGNETKRNEQTRERELCCVHFRTRKKLIICEPSFMFLRSLLRRAARKVKDTRNVFQHQQWIFLSFLLGFGAAARMRLSIENEILYAFDIVVVVICVVFERENFLTVQPRPIKIALRMETK
jgi:hypothetical protein